MMIELERLLDREIAFWRRQAGEAKTDAWLIAHGIAVGLEQAREIFNATVTTTGTRSNP
jgi:hypothetical protein